MEKIFQTYYLCSVCGIYIFFLRSMLNTCLIMIIRKDAEEALWAAGKEFYFLVCQWSP